LAGVRFSVETTHFYIEIFIALCASGLNPSVEVKQTDCYHKASKWEIVVSCREFYCCDYFNI